MKKQFSILTVAMTLLMGITSCNKDNSGAEPTDGSGTLKLSFNFKTTAAPGAKALTSEAVPTTAWENITDLKLVLVQSGKVAYVKDVTIPASGSSITPAQTFERIPVGVYDIYMIGNNSKTGNPFGSATAQLNTGGTITNSTDFNTELFKLIASTGYLGDGPTGAAYDEASELFIGYVQGTINADAETATSVSLARAVSLLRVRIDQTDTGSEANTILFTGLEGSANTSIRLRRHASSLKLTKVSPFTEAQFNANKENYAFVSTKAFKDSDPLTGYTGAMGTSNSDFSLWNDYVILPGGHAATGAEKFNLLLSGHAPNGYVGSNGVASTGSGERARVWWQADVDGMIAANGILSLNVKVSTKGFVDPNPPTFTEFGKLKITASLIDWSPVTNVDVPM